MSSLVTSATKIATRLPANELIYASLILQRDPIIMKKPTEYEKAVYDLRELYQIGKTKGLFEVKIGDVEDQAKSRSFSKPEVPAAGAVSFTENDSDFGSIYRLMENKLYLLIRKDGKWEFPSFQVTPNDTDLHEVIRNGINSLFGSSVQIYHLGRAPISVHVERFNDRIAPPFCAKHFFMKAHIVSGDMSVPYEYGWFTKGELKSSLSRGCFGALKYVLTE